jgi:hypothetical protein
MKQELSLFLLGSPVSEYLVQDSHVELALSLATQSQDNNTNKPVLKLRALWFLEKVA